jgi:hypothetical protein
MARGLSDLQKWMLVRALENAESDVCKPEYISGMGILKGGFTNPVHLGRNEIRADYYHFPVNTPWYCDKEWKPSRKNLHDDEHGTFTKSTIPNYAAVNLAITRAHRRLVKRGLMTNQVGMWLTDKGREQATLLASLVAKKSAGVDNNLMASPTVELSKVQPIAERVNHDATC